MDPQGHSAIGLGISLGYNDKNIADILLDRGSDIREIIGPTHTPNLDIVPK